VAAVRERRAKPIAGISSSSPPRRSLETFGTRIPAAHLRFFRYDRAAQGLPTFAWHWPQTRPRTHKQYCVRSGRGVKGNCWLTLCVSHREVGELRHHRVAWPSVPALASFAFDFHKRPLSNGILRRNAGSGQQNWTKKSYGRARWTSGDWCAETSKTAAALDMRRLQRHWASGIAPLVLQRRQSPKAPSLGLPRCRGSGCVTESRFECPKWTARNRVAANFT